MPLLRPVSFRFDQLSIVYFDVERWHSWQPSRECRCGGCRVWFKYWRGGGSGRWRLTHSGTWQTVNFPTGNYHTLWATNQDLQQISDIVKTLILRSFQLYFWYFVYHQSSIKPATGGGGGYFSSTLERGFKRGGLFDIAKRITCSKNAVVSKSWRTCCTIKVTVKSI